MKTLLRIIIFFSIGLFFPEFVRGQDPAPFSQFFLNRFQFNPSYAAHKGYSEINFMYRQQWLGIENAPSNASLNFQTPLGRKVSVGLTVASNKAIILNNTAVAGSVSYRVRFGSYQHLDFGASVGMAANNFDPDAMTDATSDPALTNIVSRSFFATGQFGVNYQFRNLNIGFALPEIMESEANSKEEFQKIQFDPFASKFGSLSYNFIVSKDFQVSPMLLYRSLDIRQDQLEMVVIATYRNVLWLGTSWSETSGMTAFLGLRAKGLVKVGYAYTRPSGSLAEATTGSHELYVGLRTGKKDREEEYIAQIKTGDSLKQVARLKVVSGQPPALKKQPVDSIRTQGDQSAVMDTASQTPVIAKAPVVKKKREEQVYKGYYVVVGAFEVYANALHEIRDLKERSYFPEMIYILDKNYYYVYLYHANDRSDAVRELKKIRLTFEDAWLFYPARPGSEPARKGR